MLNTPPALILPDHYQANRPAIIRPVVDLARYFPVAWDRKTRRVVVSELAKQGVPFDDRAAIAKVIEAIGVPAGIAKPRATTTKTVSFISSVTADAQTITMPTVVTGDFILYIEYPAKTSAGTDQIDVAAPTGGGTFTELVCYPTDSDKAGVTESGITVWTFGRIVTDGAGETGDVLSGYNGDTGAGRRRKFILVFRGSPVLTGFGTPESVSKIWSTGDPGDTSSPLSVGTAPFLGLAFFRASSLLSGESQTPTETGLVDNGSASSMKYTIFNSADAGTLVASMGDGGTNVLVSFVLELT